MRRLRNNTVIIVIAIIMLAAAYYYFTGRPLGSIFRRKPVLRMDPKGDGRFKASRSGGKEHNGLDFLCIPGEDVLSPIAGKIIRESAAYKDDPRYRNIVIAGAKGYEVKIMYVQLTAKVGEMVTKGQVIGKCQSIAAKYGAPMRDHVHFEFRINGKLQNPGWYIDYATKEPIT